MINGTYKILYLDLKEGVGFYPVGCLTSNSFSEESDSIDTTTRDNLGWKTSTPTNQGYSISFDGLIPTEEISLNNNTYFNLMLAKRSRTLIDWKVNEDNYGSGYINSLSDENNIDESVSFSAELTGYGKPLNRIEIVYNSYINRVISDSGVVEAKKCLLNKIYNIYK